MKPKTCLPLDVLILIMSAIQARGDVMSFASTSRSIYGASMRYILAHPVTLYRWSQLESFCQFMLNDSPPRLQHLHNLTISPDSSVLHPAMISNLVIVLQRARHLKAVSLPHPGWQKETILQSESPLVPVIASSPSLKYLLLSHSLDPTLVTTLFSTIRGPLRSLILFGDPMGLATQNDVDDSLNLFSAFSNFSSTLKHLTTNIVRMPEHLDMQFPSLESLDICCDGYGPLGPFLHLFPNLSSLEYFCESSDFGSNIRECHRSNLLLDSSKVWSKLSFVTGDLLDIYSLGLASRVDLLRTKVISGPLFEALSAVLLGTRPVSLLLHVDEVTPRDMLVFPRLLRDSVGSSLSHLGLQWFSARVNTTEVSNRDVEDCLIELSKNLTGLKFLWVRMYWAGESVDPRSKFATVDTERLAKDIVESNSSISAVCLKTPFQGSRMWVVNPRAEGKLNANPILELEGTEEVTRWFGHFRYKQKWSSRREVCNEA